MTALMSRVHKLRDVSARVFPGAAQEDRGHGAFGYVHSFETASDVDGPGQRFVLFVSGCPLRCSYCHNPDSWRLKNGQFMSARQVIARVSGFASALNALDGGLTISGGEPLVQIPFTRQILSAAKTMRLHTAIQTSGYLGDRADDSYLEKVDLVILDIKSSNPVLYRNLTGCALAPTLRFAERLAAMSKPVWVRFTLVPGATDDVANVDGVAKFVAPMKNVARVEVQPFHQLGAFKWRALGLAYPHADTPAPAASLMHRVVGQFRAAGCAAR